MAGRKKDIHAEIEEKLSEARKKFDDLRARVKEAGDDASDEVHEAVAKAEEMLDRGRSRLHDVSEASEDNFDVWWADSKKHWHDLRRDMDHHWDHLSRRVKGLFS